MTEKIILLMPPMPLYIRCKPFGFIAKDGTIGYDLMPVYEISEQDAKEYANRLKDEFLIHYYDRKEYHK
jgi:hypothetical protein